jgi:proteasome lid subunit RPN8/RPN11
MRTLILLLALTFDIRHSADDSRVLAVLRDLAMRGAQQPNEQEVAAFVVRDADGSISTVMWPHTANRRSEHYDGTIPVGTVAIAHTHPLFAERPSRGDIEQARRIGLPVYVITRWNLYVVDSTGTVVPLIKQKNWARLD